MYTMRKFNRLILIGHLLVISWTVAVSADGGDVPMRNNHARNRNTRRQGKKTPKGPPLPLEQQHDTQSEQQLLEKNRNLQKSPDPTDHYFCGRGFADASSNCEDPCPSGSLEDCPPGMLCYFDTPCDRRDIPGEYPPTAFPINPHAWIPPTQAPWAEDDPRLTRFCGFDWQDASDTCYTWCPDGEDTMCGLGQVCFGDTTCKASIPSGGFWEPPTQAPWAEDDPRLSLFCGNDWQHASDTCQTWCPDADDTKCPWGQMCFGDTSCKKRFPSPDDVWGPPTQAPWADDDPRLTFFCGTSWAQASGSCTDWCPDADDTKCPYGQSCFGNTSCKYTPEPTLNPTAPPPTHHPTPRPTGPSRAPTPAPLPLLPDDASNNMFCGTDWQQAATHCSLTTHCGDGVCDATHQYCWSNVQCDVRDYIPVEEGGRLGKLTHAEIAEKMGLTYPSDDPTDHYFCGTTFDRASEYCSIPCPDGTTESCKHGEFCFEDTPCDYRVTPGYGITNAPTKRPTLPYSARENSSFCGEDWSHANSCEMRWCGDNSACPEGQSCYGDTECNVQDRAPLPPTLSPSWSPVIYDDKTNFFFCGASYLEAVDQCSVETHCRSGEHQECGGPGLYCWPGVSCNINDMTVPTPPRTASPAIETLRPTKSPSDPNDPTSKMFCGSTWNDASASCKDGNRARWCPRGSDDECGEGEVCWADTACNIAEYILPPSPQPTDTPTIPLTWSPTDAPIQYNDPINTSFCGHSYTDAKENCSIDTHCPSVQHSECPSGGYCWTVTALECNIISLIGPTPPPTPRPTLTPSRRFMPSEAPSFPPTADPTEKPTGSPLQASDERNSFYCGTDWADANERCIAQCPLMTGCPPGLTCFSGTECSSKQKEVTESELQPTTTASSLQASDERNSFYCGTSWADANERCSAQCPLMTGCPSGLTCFSGTECSSKQKEVTESKLQPTNTNTMSLVTLPPTKLPETPYPTPRLEETDLPTTDPSSRPTVPPVSKNIPANNPNPLTSSPNMSMVAETQLAYFPYSEAAISKPPSANAERIQHIVESIQSSLEDEIFVVEMRNGAFIPSSLYTYEGFLESLNLYTKIGVNGRYFYLGQEKSRKSRSLSYAETQNEEHFEYGMANLALFIAKMMDTILYERCDPNNISCGIPALKNTLKEQSLRVQCSPLSSEAGMECPTESGCACILGALNHYIGVQSSSSNGKYSGVDFCETSLLQSICSRRTNHSEELRWIAAMTHWIYFVQQYSDESGWKYLDALQEFVRGGMVDMGFVGTVAGLSVLDTDGAHNLDGSDKKYVQNFFKVVIKLSEGMSQRMPQPEKATASPTTHPSKLANTLQTLDPTPGSRSSSRTTSPSIPSTFTPGLSSTFHPTGVPSGMLTGTPIGALSEKPTRMPTVKPVTTTSPPTPSTRDYEDDLNFVYSREYEDDLNFVVDGISSPGPVSAGAALEGSQLPGFSVENISPRPASTGVVAAPEGSQLPVLSAKNNSPPTVSAGVAMAPEVSQRPVLLPDNSSPASISVDDKTSGGGSWPPDLYASAGPLGSSTSPTPQQYLEGDVPWYRGYFTPSSSSSEGDRSTVSRCKWTFVVMITHILIF